MDRLADPAVELDAPASYGGWAIGRACQGDKSRSAQSSILAKLTRQLKATHVGHVEVDQDQMRSMNFGRTQCRLDVLGRPDPRAKPFERLTCRGEHDGVIVHNQDQETTKRSRG